MRVVRDVELVAAAHKAADAIREPEKRLTFSEALARAPWKAKHGDEKQYRLAFAERLVDRGFALRIGRSRTSGPSGESTLKRRTFKATPEELDEHDARAKAAGVPWNTWVRRKLAEP